MKWTVFFIVFIQCLHAQNLNDSGSISGVVVESWQGKPLAGATITLRGTTLATTADAQGRYTLSPVAPGEHVLRFSKSGYATATVTDVRVIAGQVTKLDGNLRPEFFDLEEYDVTAEEFQEQTIAILEERSSSAALMDSIGSDQFAKLGSGDAAEIMTKVTGVTIAEGKYAVIRGLSDRYTLTLLNGAELPSADPYRRAVQLDLFPAEMIDRMLVSKTFTPDMPGGFAGGSANIITKSFPDRFVFSFSTAAGYNTQTTLNDRFLSYNGSSTDWLALDDGTRELPPLAANTPPNQMPQAPFDASQAALAEQLNRAFENHQLAPTPDRALFNHEFSLSLGDTLKLFDRRLGFFAGINYDRDFKFYENGRRARYEGGINFDTYEFGLIPRLDLHDTRAVEEINQGAVASLSFEFNPEHEIGFTYLHNQAAEKQARRLSGYENRVSEEFPGGYFDTSVLSWTERNLAAYQFRGRHELPALHQARTDWLVSLASTSQDEPDLRFFSFYGIPQSDGATHYIFSNNFQPTYPTRYYRTLTEENINFKIDETIPFDLWNGLEAQVKSGFFYSGSDRAYQERSFQYLSQNNFDPFTTEGDGNRFLTEENLRRKTGNTFDRYVANYPINFDYTGEFNVTAYYGMLDLPVFSKHRLIAGARLESTDLGVDTLNKNTGVSETSAIQQTDALPAVSWVWNLITNMNLRASYSQTVARPTYREISPAITFDFVGGEQLVGNPDLQLSHVQNYDLRWEWFPRPGEVLSLGLFYKTIENPIERTLLGIDSRASYVNSESAALLGVELEARKQLDFIDDLLKDFSIGFNFAYIESEVPRSPVERENRERFGFPTKASRPLFDQAPYIVNADLTWSQARLGTTATVGVTYAAARLAFVNLDAPDIYEQSGPQLDFILTQRLGKGWDLKFSAKNLLDPDFKHIYDPQDTSSEFIYASHRKGMTFKLGLAYKY